MQDHADILFDICCGTGSIMSLFSFFFFPFSGTFSRWRGGVAFDMYHCIHDPEPFFFAMWLKFSVLQELLESLCRIRRAV